MYFAGNSIGQPNRHTGQSKSETPLTVFKERLTPSPSQLAPAPVPLAAAARCTHRACSRSSPSPPCRERPCRSTRVCPRRPGSGKSCGAALAAEPSSSGATARGRVAPPPSADKGRRSPSRRPSARRRGSPRGAALAGAPRGGRPGAGRGARTGGVGRAGGRPAEASSGAAAA